MHSELRAVPRLEHAGTTTTPSTVFGSVGVDLDIDRGRGERDTGGWVRPGIGDVADEPDRQSGGPPDADVAAREVPGGPGRQRPWGGYVVARPPLTYDSRQELVVVALATTCRLVEGERVAIEEPAAGGSRWLVDLGCVNCSVLSV